MYSHRLLKLVLASIALVCIACGRPSEEPAISAARGGTVTPVTVTSNAHVPLTIKPLPTQAAAEPAALPLPTMDIPVPAVFTSTLLAHYVEPQTYLTDMCGYLRAKWDPSRSSPGTIVVPIMFHSVKEGGTFRPGDTSIPVGDLNRITQTARELGFQTITIPELVGFLEYNCRIPPRSMIWIVDDRRPQMLKDYFLPIARENGWTISLGWIVGNTTWIDGLWKTLEVWQSEGVVDVQSHGLEHRYLTESTPDDVIREELSGSLGAFHNHLGIKPVAYVWPGGNYSSRALELAREAGYRVAFTVNSRGPLMYNWIPLFEREIELGDPLMLLPRYWASPSLPEQLRNAAAIGENAARKALEDYRQDALYYQVHCGCELPPPPDGKGTGEPLE